MSKDDQSGGSEQQELFAGLRVVRPGNAQLHARSRMLGKATHEIYNTSTFLVANLTTLRGDIVAGELDHELAVEMLDECLEGMGRTTDVLRRLRELSRQNSKIGVTNLDLSEVMRQVCVRLGQQRGLELRMDLQPTIVRGSLEVLFYGLEQILDVWLRRLPALEASVGLGLLIRVHSVDGMGLVEIRDVRDGIEQSLPDGLFDAFRKGDTHEIGTRLFIFRSMLEEIGGSLDATLDGGQAVITVRLLRS